MTIGSLVSGRLLDWEWRNVSEAYRAKKASEKGGEAMAEVDIKKARDDPDFPIEYVRSLPIKSGVLYSSFFRRLVCVRFRIS